MRWTWSVRQVAAVGAACVLGVAVAPLAGTAAAGAAAVGAASPRASAAAARGPVAVTVSGRVRGRVAGRTEEFLGIPYAAPPVGELRWRAPQPARPWSGVRAVAKLPPRCPQPRNGNGPMSSTENCLYLSIYRPRGTTARNRLPVLFWIHGGGLTTGSGDQHDGALFAQTDGIEVVSINYRLGPFGFLDLPGLPGGAAITGDYGLLDQEAALRWTGANIAHFGGDPRRVTIAGESAGGYSVCSLLASPRARGLFRRAIIQSGSCATTPAAVARRSAEAFARGAGCRVIARMAACLRGRSARTLLHDRAYPAADLPIAGGQALPIAAARQVARGDFAHVPVLVGTNQNEGRTFAQGFAHASKATYLRTIRAGYGRAAGKVLAQYPWASFAEPYRTAYAVAAVWTDSGYEAGIGGCAEQHLVGELARRTRTYFYEFDDLSAPGLNRAVPGYDWGAGHAMELAYMWPSFNNGYSLYRLLTPAQRGLSRWMVRYWGAFVRTGDPSVAGQAPWPSYNGTGRLMALQEGTASSAVPGSLFSAEHDCGFWQSLPGWERALS